MRTPALATATLLALCLCDVGPLFASTVPARRAIAPVTGASTHAESTARPLIFEENRGQADARSRFLVRGGNGTTFVTADGLAVVLAAPDRRGGVALEFRLDGASRAAVVEGERQLPGIVNYLKGDDPSRWRTNVPTYASVRCRDAYPGVDVVYYSNGGDLEYDFVVAPDADASAIRLTVDGARGTRVDAATGDLVVETALGEVRQQAPALYQMTAVGRRTVAGRYVARGSAVGIEPGAYDRSLALVVDPVLRFSTYVGGSQAEALNAVALDPNDGSVYAAGNTFSTDYPATPGAFQTDQADDDVVVTKLNPAGNTLAYSTYIGGDAGDFCSGVALDASGNAYLTGVTFSTNYPTLNQLLGNQTASDAYLTRLNATGTGLVYSTYLGGSGEEGGGDVAVFAPGLAFVTGGTDSVNFPTTPSAYQTTLGAGGSTVFMTEINTVASGAGSLVYSTYLGDAGQGVAIAVDAMGRAYVAGHADGTGFPTTAGAFQTDQPGQDGFVSKIDPTVSGVGGLVYSTYLGGSMLDTVEGIAVDSSGRAHVTGTTMSNNFPTTASSFQPTAPNIAPGDMDAIYTVVNATGTMLAYSSFLGGADDEQGFEIALDAIGQAYIAGETASANFPTTSGAISGDLLDRDGFVSRFDSSRGGAAGLVSSTYLGGNGLENALGIAANENGEAVVVGFTSSTDFPTLNPFQTDQMLFDGFVTKLSLDAGATGSDTVGIYAAGTGSFFLKNANGPGGADVVFSFGAGGSVLPLVGDWNGDGVTTIGLYDPGSGAFFLRNSNTPGVADVVFTFGAGGAGIVPLVGDWNGDGTDTIGLYSTSTGAFFLKNSNSSGAADLVFTFGAGGLVPITGDWNGDGVDTPGLYDSGSGFFFLRNSNTPGPAHIVFGFGAGGGTPLVGDFDNDGVDTIGLYVPGTATWFLRNRNAAGAADAAFTFGGSSMTPLVGDWNGL